MTIVDLPSLRNSVLQGSGRQEKSLNLSHSVNEQVLIVHKTVRLRTSNKDFELDCYLVLRKA